MPTRRDSIKTLSTIAQIIQKSDPNENPLSHIVMMVREQMNVDVCSLYLLQDKQLILVATDGLDPSSIGKVRMAPHEGLTGLAVEKLQPIIVNEASLHPRFKYFPETGEEKFSTFAGVPLMERDKVVGVLTVQTVAKRDLEAQEIELLKLFAFQLATVIRNLVTLEVLRVGKEPERPTSLLKGISVAPGFGIATAFFLRPGVSPVILPAQQKSSFGAKEEWKRLSLAIRKASGGLLRLEKKLQKRFSKRESDIFYSHRMILSDRTFLKKLRTVVDRGATAVDAVCQVIGEYIQDFEKIEDPHFRERAADLEDLRQRIMDNLRGGVSKRKQEEWEGVLVAETIVPSDTARLDPECIQGIVTERGGVTSHAAIIARSLGIPAVMGVPNLLSKIRPGDTVIVDGNVGIVYVNPEKTILQEYEKIQEQYADRIVHQRQLIQEVSETKDGRRVVLEANVGLFSGLGKIRQAGAEGVGLYRTEFPFIARKKLLDENEQFELYCKVIEEVEGLPITFRLLDAGGDKPLEALGLQASSEANPFLGYRSIRLSLSRPEILTVQLRALLRTSAIGPVRILVPMISGVEEVQAVRKILNGIMDEFRKKRIAFDEKIQMGLMIEVPSAVWMAHLLIQDCDFFSIGTNDLIQYTLAVDRNNEKVAQFFEPLHPAVLNAIAQVACVGQHAGKRVSICGEIAGDPFLAPLWLGLGVTGLSMISSNIPAVKTAIRSINYERAKTIADQALKAPTVDQIKTLLEPLRQDVEKAL